MRTLDDCYGAYNERFPLEQEHTPPQVPLEWEERPLFEVVAYRAAALAAARLASMI